MGHKLICRVTGRALVLIVAASVGLTACGDNVADKQAASPTTFASTETEAGKQLRPGNYIVYDAPFQNEGQGLKSGVASFTVEGEGEDGAELPTAAARIEAYEYGFRVSGLTTGKNTIEFSNTGREAHHVIAVPYAPGATLAKVRKAFTSVGGAEAPLDFENTSYTARIAGGTKQITELALDKPGTYALLCFVSDRKGGPPHVAQGMVAEVTVR